MAVAAPLRVALAESASPREAQVKAVFLYNFGSFVTWPSSAFTDAGAPIRYCTTAKGVDANVLQEALRDERIGDRAIEYRQVGADDDHQACHVLYLTDMDATQSKDVLQRLGSAPVLTVSDRKRFASTGGMIELSLKRKRIRPVINLSVTRDAGLKPSSKLLRLAKIVGE